jgi:hypothetical protein
MAQPKIIALGLEDLVVDARGRGRSLSQIADECNAALAERVPLGTPASTVSKESVKRYLATLDRATVAPAHAPQAAEANALVSIEFGRRLTTLDKLLARWLTEADEAERTVQVGMGDTATFETIPDWQARTGIAREMRELLKVYADLMQRIHDAQQVAAFQQSVVEAIREASPEVAASVVAKLRERQSIQRAALLGAA